MGEKNSLITEEIAYVSIIDDGNTILMNDFACFFFFFIYIFSLKCFPFTDRHVEKESLAEYIAKKREMFLVQVITYLFSSSQMLTPMVIKKIRH